MALAENGCKVLIFHHVQNLFYIHYTPIAIVPIGYIYLFTPNIYVFSKY